MGAFVFLGAFALGLRLSGQRVALNHDAQSIVEVFAKRNEAISRAKQQPLFPGSTALHFDAKTFVSLLDAIDTSNCPPRFRSAWHDYTYAVRKNISFAHAVIAVTSLVYKADPSEMLSSEGNDAWNHLESVALEYGVDVKMQN